MKDYKLVGAGKNDEGVPVFEFDVLLRSGQDLDGKFDIQFAAVEHKGNVRFALNSPKGVLGIFTEEAGKEIVDKLVEHKEYIVVANYENTEWETPTGQHAMVLMGRDFGMGFDHRERSELDNRNYEAIQQIQDVLKQGIEK